MLDDYTMVTGMSSDYSQLRDQAREFAAQHVAPITRQIDEEDYLPQALWDALTHEDRRYLGSHIPKEYGGAGRDLRAVTILMEEISAANFAVGTMIEITTVCPLFVMKYGTEQQKREILPSIPTGESFMGFMLTDKGSGSDAANLHTVARQVGDTFVINGFKRLASMVDHATLFVVIVRGVDTQGRDLGPTAILVPQGTEGMKIEEKQEVIGLHGHRVYSVSFDDVTVPVTNVLGEYGRGVDMAVNVLSDTRPTLAGGFVGVAKAALDIALDFARGWESFNRPIYKHQGIGFPLAEMSARVEASRLMAYRAAFLADSGVPHDREAAQAKFFCSEVAIDAIRLAISVLGHTGATKQSLLEMYLRDALSFDMAQGSPQIAKLVASRALFA